METESIIISIVQFFLIIFVYRMSKDLRVAKKLRKELELQKLMESRKHHLNLCIKHQQEQNRSHFSEHNCDYCKALKRIKELERG